MAELTRKGVQWNWSRDCEESYQTLCGALSNNIPITLCYPEWSNSFYLEVDASCSVDGAVIRGICDRYGI